MLARFSSIIFVFQLLCSCLRWAAASALLDANINFRVKMGGCFYPDGTSCQKTTELTQISSVLVKSSYSVYICFHGELHRLCRLTVLTGVEHLVQ